MRGYDRPQSTMLTLVNPEQRVPANHPIRLIKELAEVALKELSPLFEQMYSEVGRPSIPPERLLKASLLMALYTVRSERMFCEQLDYNLLFRWFLDLNWDEPGFDHSTFSRNRARLLEHDVAGEFFRTVVAEARELKLTSDEHFTVDGTLIEAWASLKSLKRPRMRATERVRPPIQAIRAWTSTANDAQNATHQSTTDPEARLAKKGAGKEAKLCYTENVLMENRNGIMIDLFRLNQRMDGPRGAQALAMVGARSSRAANGSRWVATKATIRTTSLESCRALNVTPHVAQNLSARRAALRSTLVRCAITGLRRQPMGPQAGRRNLRLDEDHRQLPSHPLSGSRAGADACLPGRRGLQPAQNRQAQSRSRMKPAPSTAPHRRSAPKAAAQHS